MKLAAFALALMSALTLQMETAAGLPRPREWAVLASADLDGDGRAETVLGEKTPVTGAYRGVYVESAAGKELLHLQSEQFFQSALVGQQEFPRAVLVTTQAAGANMMDVRAFSYNPRTDRLEPLGWDGRAVASARKVEMRPGAVILYTWEGAPLIYRFHGDRLVRQK